MAGESQEHKYATNKQNMQEPSTNKCVWSKEEQQKKTWKQWIIVHGCNQGENKNSIHEAVILEMDMVNNQRPGESAIDPATANAWSFLNLLLDAEVSSSITAPDSPAPVE